MNLPLLALALPAAGHGAAHLRALAGRRNLVLAAVATAPFAYALVASMPHVLRAHVLPSSHYAPLLRWVGARLGTPVATTDKIVLRASEAIGEVELDLSQGYRFFAIDDQREAARGPDGARLRTYRWRPDAERRVLVIDVFARRPPGALECSVRAESGETASFDPLVPSGWRRWLPTGLAGLEYRWQGGGEGTPGR